MKELKKKDTGYQSNTKGCEDAWRLRIVSVLQTRSVALVTNACNEVPVLN
jgi:hypothetical protein